MLHHIIALFYHSDIALVIAAAIALLILVFLLRTLLVLIPILLILMLVVFVAVSWADPSMASAWQNSVISILPTWVVRLL